MIWLDEKVTLSPGSVVVRRAASEAVRRACKPDLEGNDPGDDHDPIAVFINTARTNVFPDMAVDMINQCVPKAVELDATWELVIDNVMTALRLAAAETLLRDC